MGSLQGSWARSMPGDLLGLAPIVALGNALTLPTPDNTGESRRIDVSNRRKPVIHV